MMQNLPCVFAHIVLDPNILCLCASDGNDHSHFDFRVSVPLFIHRHVHNISLLRMFLHIWTERCTDEILVRINC